MDPLWLWYVVCVSENVKNHESKALSQLLTWSLAGLLEEYY